LFDVFLSKTDNIHVLFRHMSILFRLWQKIMLLIDFSALVFVLIFENCLLATGKKNRMNFIDLSFLTEQKFPLYSSTEVRYFNWRSPLGNFVQKRPANHFD